MHSRLYKQLAALVIVAATSGCVQATRHSNTMVFGTNTSLGIKVGTDTAQVPSINVGYERQEAVIMPLVANTEDDGTYQKPCDFSRLPSLSSDVKYRVHPCSLVAYKGDAQDSYSVLASFGANFDASGGTSNGVKGGLAQYFATGMAAQILALTGGAAVVAVGDAAKESAQNAPEAAKAVRSLFGKPFGQGDIFKNGQSYASFEQSLTAKIGPAAVAGNLQSKITAFETIAGISTGMRAACTTADACRRQLSNEDEYYELFRDPAVAKKMHDAIDNNW
jgi:hypothetical protein